MYSQSHEDAIFLPLLPKIGRMMEIGAYHPTYLSNSRALILVGWEAVLVEPDPFAMSGLVDFYRTNISSDAVTLINALVTTDLEPTLTPFHLGGAMSTTEATHMAEYRDIPFREIHLFSTPIHQLFASVGKNFDFISIDTEGSSYNLFAYIANQITPKAISVEYNATNERWIVGLAGAAGYKLVHRSNENLILFRDS